MDDRRVLHSLYSWLPQTMVWLYQQISNLHGWRSLVVCQKVENLDQFSWVDLHYLESHGKLHVLAYKVCRALGLRRHPRLYDMVADSFEPHVLHSHFGPQGWKDMLLAKRLGIPHVVSFYGVDVSMFPQKKEVWRKRYIELFGHISAVLCEGPHMASCIKDLGCPSEKIHVHHLGVDLDDLPFRPRNWRPREPLRILCAAAFREKKGLEYAVEAVGRFKSDYPDVDVRLTIIGDAIGTRSSLRIKRRILRLVNEWGLSDRTRILGFQPFNVVIEEAYRHHIFLSPSVTASDGDTEGGAPVSIIQMAATGMPVVATKHCDIPHVLAEPNRELLVSERDALGLSRSLATLASESTLWDEIACANRRLIEQEFSVKKQGMLMAGIYNALVEGSREIGVATALP